MSRLLACTDQLQSGVAGPTAAGGQHERRQTPHVASVHVDAGTVEQ